MQELYYPSEWRITRCWRKSLFSRNKEFFMIKIVKFSMLSILLFFYSCSSKESVENEDSPTVEEKVEIVEIPTLGDSILNRTIEAHGGDLYDNASFSFEFREREYSFTNSMSEYSYSVLKHENEQEIKDILTDEGFTRFVDDEKVELAQDDIDRYSESLNSVIYFATLPYKLRDESVNVFYAGKTSIKSQEYEILNITFQQEGGGKDHEDNFHYWINNQTDRVDFLAYNYKTGGGGVRFRAAYNTRVIGGIIFQDFVNYSAPIGTALIDLPALYENGELEELSRIETEKVVNLNAN
jgi:Family of unknown function (DUF6503)